MLITEILKQSSHRPWELSNNPWKYYQEWNKAIFLHWKVDVNELRKFVPSHLEIDLFENEAWVSVVIFTMEKIRPKHFPPFSPITTFEEINIRTYVKYNGKSGVYFLSIEASNLLSCKIAKALSELPYRFSSMKRTLNTHSSSNNKTEDKIEIKFNVLEDIKEKSEIDKWLTERYALFQDDAKGNINEFEIHHVEWPIFKVDFSNIELSYDRFSKMIDNKPHLTHYSSGVQVVAWEKRKHIIS
jgi:uncharacterized protein